MEVGGRATKGFVLVDQATLTSGAIVAQWLQQGLDFGRHRLADDKRSG